MIGGFLRGVVAGVAVSAAALVVLSVLTEAPPSAVPPDLGAATGAPEAPATPAAPAQTDAQAPGPEAAATHPAEDAAPALAATPAAEAAPAAPAAPAEPPADISATAPAAPVVPAAPADSAPPAVEAGPAVQETPVQPEAPVAEPPPAETEAAPLPDEKLLAPAADALAEAAPQVDDPAPIVKEETPPAASPAPAAVPPAPAAEAAPALTPDPVPAAPEADPDVLPEDGLAEPGDVPAEGETVLPALPEDGPSGPTPGLRPAVEGVTVDRLPQVGDAPVDPAPSAATAEEVPAETVDLPPLQRDARAFENPDQKPLFAIILIDTGAADIDRAALAAIPFPVSFALDPMDPATPDRAKLYRDAGQEVLMLATGLPEGAQASDVEVALSVMGAALPQAVAVLDTEAGAFQGDRPLATGVIPVIASQGRGVVTWDRGLNAADQVARRDGVPSAVIFRALDGEGEASAVIRRYLDRAAFKAAQEGHVVVAGSTRPETVAALMEWAVEGRSSSVALAPVTAVLALP